MSKTILLVEDDWVTARIYQGYLRKLGYEVLWSWDGFGALRFAAKPDVALLDLMLPGMSGLELLKELRDRRPEMPIIVCTSVMVPSVAEEAMAAGATLAFSKSDITLHSLEDALENVLKRSESHHLAGS